PIEKRHPRRLAWLAKYIPHSRTVGVLCLHLIDHRSRSSSIHNEGMKKSTQNGWAWWTGLLTTHYSLDHILCLLRRHPFEIRELMAEPGALALGVAAGVALAAFGGFFQ